MHLQHRNHSAKWVIHMSFIFFVIGNSFGQFTENIVSHGTSTSFVSTLIDIDSDGDSDFISSASGKIFFRINDGNGNFGALNFIPLPNGSFARTIMAIDIDDDGLNDIVTYNTDYYIKWHRNLGNNTYTGAMVLAQTNQFYVLKNVSAVDMDNDGDLDIIGHFTNPFSTFYWFENLGNSTFGPENIINTGTTNISTLKVYDLNQDGLPDVVYTLSNKIACVYNQGGGLFGPEILIANTVVSRVFAFDNDNDNDLDVGYWSSSNDNISLFENINSSSFGPEQVIQSSIPNLQNAINTDIDNDGDQDIIAFATNNLVYYENQGGGNFSNSILIHPTTPPYDIGVLEVLDIDTDGQDDIYVGTFGIMWYKKIGIVNFSTIAPISVAPEWPHSSTVADFDGDGEVDIATAAESSHNVAWYQNKGDDTFSTANTLLKNILENKYIESADLNNDGLPDIVTNSGGHVGWMRNMGNGEFLNYAVLFSWSIPWSFDLYNDIELGDIDNDGNIDIVVRYGSGLRYLKNLGNNQFEASLTTVPSTSSGLLHHDLSLSDINDDGLLDVVYIITDGIAWQENLGNGTFGGELIVTNLVNQPRAVSVADFDNDGLKDIVSISYNDNKIAWYKNLGGNQFGTQQIISTAIIQPTELASEDLNGDNLIDLIIGNVDEVSWYENIGSGQFPVKTTIINNLNALTSIVVAETDGDGDMDIVITTKNDDCLRVLGNNYVHDYQVSGRVFYDKDQNGAFDNNDSGIPNSAILTNPNSSYSFSYLNGFYNTIFNDTIGIYDIYSDTIPYWNITTTPTSYQVNVTPSFTNQNNLDFGFYPDVFFEEVSPLLVVSGPNCNDTVSYWVNVTNSGTLKNSGIVELKLDPLNQYYSSSNVPDSIVGNSIYWHYDSLEVFNQLQLNVAVILPDFLSMGTDLIDSLIVSVLDVNGTISNQFKTGRNQLLTCAYDPNDKSVFPKGTTSSGYIPMDTEWLEYTIRFQNTGTNTAQNIRIDDVLDNNIEQIVPLSSSHDMHVVVDENNMASFHFNNINLPDSSSNFLGSQGYVAYKAKLKSNLIEGTQISNFASIYFDYNPAIITNTVINTLHEEDVASINEIENKPKFIVYPNPFTEMVTVEFVDYFAEGYYVEVYDVLGQKLISKTNFESNQLRFFSSDLGTGLLYFKLYSSNEELVQVIKCISFD